MHQKNVTIFISLFWWIRSNARNKTKLRRISSKIQFSIHFLPFTDYISCFPSHAYVPLVFQCPQGKYSSADRLGDLAGHVMFGNLDSQTVRWCAAVSVVAPSCWKWSLPPASSASTCNVTSTGAYYAKFWFRPPRRTRSNSRPVKVGFVVHKVAVAQLFFSE